jgi:hypothetical protein
MLPICRMAVIVAEGKPTPLERAQRLLPRLSPMLLGQWTLAGIPGRAEASNGADSMVIEAQPMRSVRRLWQSEG